jgi:hypothetical protein
MGIPSEHDYLELYYKLSGAKERLTRFHQVFNRGLEAGERARRDFRPVRSEPVYQPAHALIAGITLRLEFCGVGQLHALARLRKRRAGKLRGQRLEFEARRFKRAKLLGKEGVRPGGAQFDAAEHVDHAIGLAHGEIAVDAG